MVGLGHTEVVGTDYPVGRPGQAHHGGEPGQGSGIAGVDAVGGQQQAAHRHHPQQRPDIGNQLLGKVRPLFPAPALALPSKLGRHARPNLWAKAYSSLSLIHI